MKWVHHQSHKLIYNDLIYSMVFLKANESMLMNNQLLNNYLEDIDYISNFSIDSFTNGIEDLISANWNEEFVLHTYCCTCWIIHGNMSITLIDTNKWNNIYFIVPVNLIKCIQYIIFYRRMQSRTQTDIILLCT